MRVKWNMNPGDTTTICYLRRSTALWEWHFPPLSLSPNVNMPRLFQCIFFFLEGRGGAGVRWRGRLQSAVQIEIYSLNFNIIYCKFWFWDHCSLISLKWAPPGLISPHLGPYHSNLRSPSSIQCSDLKPLDGKSGVSLDRNVSFMSHFV